MGWGSRLKRQESCRFLPGEQYIIRPTAEVARMWRPAFTRGKVDWDHLVSLDFETYYDEEYTLKKLSTSEYIRDPRFETIMVGIKIGAHGTTKVYRGGKDARKAIAAIDWSKHDLLCHHNHFDGLILSHHYGIVPRKYYCSLSMARAWLSNDVGAGLHEVSQYFGRTGKLDEGKALINMIGIHLKDMHPEVYRKGSEYCAYDVDEMLRCFNDLLPNFSQPELELIDATVQMFTCPVLKLDEARARKALQQEIAERKALILAVAPEDVALDTIQSSWRSDWKKAGGGSQEDLRIFVGKKIIGSGPRFAALLEAEGVDPPMKISPAWLKLDEAERAVQIDKQFIYAFAATDPAFMELLDDSDPRIRALCEARVAVKSNTSITRAERLLRSGANGRALPVYYKYAGAHTWRFSGGDKQNWQNFKRGGELRLSILAPRGYVLVVGDSSQIEARVNAWLWGQTDLIDAFRRGEDIYSLFATESIYGTLVTKADKERRHVGKTAILGLGFQMGHKKFRATLARGQGGPAVQISEETSIMIVQAYRKRYSKIAEGWTICTRIIEDMAAGRKGEYKCLRWEKETIWLPNGMRLKYPRLKQQDNGDWTYTRKGNVIKIYGGLLCENIVQALARIIVAAEQLLAIAATYPVVMTTHDEVVSCVPKREAKTCERFMQECLKRPPPWAPDLPVTCETGYAENYSK